MINKDIDRIKYGKNKSSNLKSESPKSFTQSYDAPHNDLFSFLTWKLLTMMQENKFFALTLK